MRAHVSAAGAPQKKGLDPALDRSRGGFGSQIHILADQRGCPLCLRLTGGPRHDSTQARALVEAWIGARRARPSRLIADWAYDYDGFRAWRAQRGIEAVLPARGRHLNPQPHDPEPYQARNAVERGIGWLKHGRRGATCYDKIRKSFPCFSVPGRSLDLDEGKALHYLVYGQVATIRGAAPGPARTRPGTIAGSTWPNWN